MDDIPKMSTEWLLRESGNHATANILPGAPSWGGETYTRRFKNHYSQDDDL